MKSMINLPKYFSGILLVYLSLSVVTLSSCFTLDSVRERVETNEAMALVTIKNVISSQLDTSKKDGRLEDVSELRDLLKLEETGNVMQKQGYQVEIRDDKKHFQIWLVPVKYGITGRKSYFFDSRSGIVYEGDHKGSKANNTDTSIFELSDEDKIMLSK